MMFFRSPHRPIFAAKPTDAIRGHALLCFIVFLLSIASRSTVAQSVEALLYDETMEPTPITLTALDHEQVTYVDTSGETHERPLSEILRLDFPVDPEKIREALTDYSQDVVGPMRMATLVTVDGQRFVYVFQGVRENESPLWFDDDEQGPDPEMLDWMMDLGLSGVEVSLDDVFVMQLDSSVPLVDDAADDDVLTLLNGDTLHGYTEGVSGEGIRFTIDGATEPVVFALDRVAAIQIANALEPAERQGIWVTSAYGSSFRCRIERTQVINEEHYGLELWMAPLLAPGVAEASQQWASNVGLGILPSEPAVYGDTITRLDFALGRFHLQPLATIPMTQVSGGEVFGQPMPPRQEHGLVVLHAPVETAFDLPRNARRLAMTAALTFDQDIPADRHAWASCDLVILEGDDELFRQTIDAENPEHQINVELSGGELTFRLESGANGPVLDRIELREAEVLIENE